MSINRYNIIMYYKYELQHLKTDYSYIVIFNIQSKRV